MTIHKEDLPGGGFFASADSFEEVLDYMGKLEDTANTELFPEQKAMLSVSEIQYFMNPFSMTEFVIFGEAWSVDNNAASLLDSYKVKTFDDLNEEEQSEFRSAMQSMLGARARGYFFGRAYSVACEDGELGDTHVSQMWPISKEAFEEARAAGWRPQLAGERIDQALRAYIERITAK